MSPRKIIRIKLHRVPLLGLLALLAGRLAASEADLPSLRADREAIERVYYKHRLGTKPPFEQVSPPSLIEKLVRDDLRKEAVLKRVYHVEISADQVAAEMRRIQATTRAPEVLAELNTALGNDPARFARAVARPIVVERLLRDKFENDDALHAPQRRIAGRAREHLLAAKRAGAAVSSLVTLLRQDQTNQVVETTWQLGPPSPETNAAGADLAEVQKRFGPKAQVLSPPRAGGREQTFYFDDLPGELRNVLRVQLRQAGDVSAVIETPAGFLLYVAVEKTCAKLGVAGLSVPKRRYEQWLAEQTVEAP